tara:strand:- start:1215 stop:1478 length:264 start_codon:yes stop_codon:yes gene_type:complete
MENNSTEEMAKFSSNTGKIGAMLSILKIDINTNRNVDSETKIKYAQEINKICSLLDDTFDIANKLVVDLKYDLKHPIKSTETDEVLK